MAKTAAKKTAAKSRAKTPAEPETPPVDTELGFPVDDKGRRIT